MPEKQTKTNQYRPWEAKGITELEYFKRAYLDMSAMEMEKQSRLDKIAEEAEILIEMSDGMVLAAQRHAKEILTLAKGAKP